MASKKGILVTIIILAVITSASFLLWVIPENNETTFIVSDYEGYYLGVKNIQEVLMGQVWVPEAFQQSSNDSDSADIAERVASLTQQQYRILMMFAQGMLNKQIAYDLNVSEATIKAHATAIFRKLNVRNRTQAVIAISQLDIADPSFSG